jgi:hypothetical protein
LWKIPTASPAFMDTRVITDGAISFRHGLDPLRTNPYDSSGRPVNYPHIWQGLYRLGLNERHSVPLGVTLVGLFVAGLALVVRRLDGPQALGVLAAVFSPSVLLGAERGNTDLAMFFLLAVALWASERSRIWPVVVVLFGFVLKLYPLLGLGLILGRRRAAINALAASAAFAVLYLLFSWDDIGVIRAVTPKSVWFSYGVDVLWIKLQAGPAQLGRWAHFLSWVAVAGTAAWAVTAWMKRNPAIGAEAEGGELDAFRVGAACYAGTFLLGTNFNYRLMFLVFAIPQLVTWARGAFGSERRLARIALVAAYASLWLMWFEGFPSAGPLRAGVVFGLEQAANWTLFGVLLVLGSISLPGWLAFPGRGLPRSLPVAANPAAATE